MTQRASVCEFRRRVCLWVAWKVLPSGYVVGYRSFGGVVREEEGPNDSDEMLYRGLMDSLIEKPPHSRIGPGPC